jgi:hypothetical protein
LRGAAGGKIEHIERQDDVLLATKLAETDGFIIEGGEGKVGSDLSNVYWHRLSFLAWPLGRNTLAHDSLQSIL